MAESNLAKQVDLYLKSLGEDCWFFNVQGGASQKAGVPDRIVCYNGEFIALELKRPDGKGTVSPRQKIEMQKIDRAGGYTRVIETLEELEDLIWDIDHNHMGNPFFQQ